METFRYKCPCCGLIYSVPAYWMSFSAEDTTDFPHMKPGTDEVCGNTTLEHIPEE